ncbi:MAG: radical SAM protein [Candidatus Eremiobacteraeota bacterium]|nr:radical SAM protein [Candidatus Eremiobacteraeota bacterium]
MEWTNYNNPFNSVKVLAHFRNLLGIRDWKLLPPVSVDIDPSNRCNLKCPWCIQSHAQQDLIRNDAELPAYIMERFGDFLSQWGVKACCIGGSGESLMNENINVLIKSLHDNKIQTSMISNGILLDRLEHPEYFDFIGISVDAATAKVWSLVKGISENEELFQRVLDNIAHIVHKTEVGFKFLTYKDNVHEIVSAAKLARDLGCRLFHARPCYTTQPEQHMSMEEIRKANELLDAARTIYETDAFKVYSIYHKYTHDFKKKIKFTKCRVTPLRLTFGADMKAYLCCDRRGEYALAPFAHGFDQVISKWGSEEHYKLMESIDISKCPRCTYSGYQEIFEKAILNDGMNINHI